MSFSFSASGTKDEVLRQLDDQALDARNNEQKAKAVEFIRAEIEASPEGSYSVSAYGHADAATRNLTIAIQPQAATGGQQPQADAAASPERKGILADDAPQQQQQ